MHYLDDFLFAAPTAEASATTERVRRDLHRLGLVCSEKADFIPAVEKEFIGFRVNAATGRLSVTDWWKASFLEAA